MRLRGEVDDRLTAQHRSGDDLAILDRPLDELDPLLHVGEVLAPTGVGELVEHDDLISPLLEGEAHVRGADEPGAAGHEDPHRASARSAR